MIQSVEHFFTNKDFRGHIKLLLQLLEQNIPFAFNRISDGELFILNNQSIELTARGALIDGVGVNRQSFSKWDCKSFDPQRDTFITSQLPSVLSSDNPLYLLGLPCICCADPREVINIRTKSAATWTWANLLVNGNYPFFIEKLLPQLQSMPLMAAVNHAATDSLFNPCPAYSRFNVPDDVIQSADKVVQDFLYECSKLKDGTVVLVGASVVAKIMIHKGFSAFPSLSFIDIGTTLNPLLSLGLGRDYLRDYWLTRPLHLRSPYSSRLCIW